MKKRMLIVTSHLSTGGLPQFSLNRVELLKDEFEIMLVEYDFLSSHFVVQRNKIMDILGNNFKSLGDNKEYLLDIIEFFDPNVIFMEEFPENFMANGIAKKIYTKSDRKYTILETTHSSNNSKDNKKWLPDKFIFVSEYSGNIYKDLGVPYEIVQYPIDKKIKDIDAKNRLGFDPDYKHVINIGLFTQGKNQGYSFELARKLLNYKIKFHFVGNMAINFKEYWDSIMKNKPSNCVIWGERSDVDDFLMSSDLFLFTSKFELNPLVIKEALCYDLPQLIFNLETYCGLYNGINGINFLTGNLDIDSKKIISILNPMNINDGPEFLFESLNIEKKEDFIFNDRSKLPQFLNNLGLTNKGVEIGSFKGHFAKTILENWSGKLYMVDVWRALPTDEYDDCSNHKDHEDAYLETMKNISGFEDRAFMMRMKSENGSEMFEDGSLDFAYVDANHMYQFVKTDIELWYPKVKSGGLVMGHDYIKRELYKNKDKDIPIMAWNDTDPEPKYAGMFGVTTAVDEFVAENGYDLSVTDEFFGTWWFIKK